MSTDFGAFSADLLANYGATTDESGIETSPNARLPGTEPCIICGADTKGLHFQVVSCRACAAFFKRSLQLRKVYQCRTGYRDCDLTKTPSGKPICRFCRLNKCHAVGMRLDGTSASSESSSAVQSPSEVVVGTISHRVVNGNRIARDFNQTIAEIKQILSQPYARDIPGVPLGVHHSCFQQIQYAFAAFRQKVCPAEKLTPLRTYDKLLTYPFMESYSIHVAEMLQSCQQFAELPFADKFRLYRYAWSALYHLERVFSSIQLYGTDVTDGRMLYTKDIAIDIKKSGVYADLHPSKFQELMKFCFPLKESMFNHIMKPMKQLNLSSFEFSYMVAYMMFNVYEVRNLTEETVQIGEHLLDHFSSELHNYYVYEQHLPSYASRLARMLRMISFSKQHSSHIKDYMIMAKVFDIFVCDIYETELFE